ncbi:hypothetical protein FRC17_008559 [Serendipita sp. 399]|nr:hypothetical protein FRC17_008559 [Serendipita sp. 399]
MTNAKKPVKVKPRKQIFSLVDSIHEAETSFRTSSDVTPKHRFEITLELASFTNEKFELYKDYQFHIHKEIEKKASSFEHFLCDTCLVSTPIPYNGTPPSHLPRYYGTHHQLYRIDGELVAMSVLDILPNCVSGVYFMYASKWEKCQLGKLSVLREAALVREMYATGLKELKWNIGFYIQSCQKMRYKGDYSPSYLLDTESYSWYPLSECTPLLDKYRYACFSNPSHSANEVVLHKFPEKKQKHMNDIKIAQISGAQFVHSPLSKQPTKVWASHKERIVQTVDALGSELSRSVYFRLQAISPTAPTQIIDVRFDADCKIFTCSTPSGFAVYRSNPLTLVSKREVKGGTLSIILPLHSTSLLFLVGGGRSPRYSRNKVIFWDEAQGKEVAELEFSGDVMGLACRRQNLAVALKRRVILFEITNTVKRLQQWETTENSRGLVALATAPGSTLLAFPGRQTGHLQLVYLPPCPAPPTDSTPGSSQAYQSPRLKPVPLRRDPVTHIVAHTSALASISVSPSGRYVATTSETGTLIRIWDTDKGKNSHEFRRGIDQAHIYGVAFRPDEKECCAWSDKGTVHFFSLERLNRTSVLRHVSALFQNNYLSSEWSYAQYRLPTPPAHVAHSLSQTNRLGVANPDAGDEEKWTVGWIEIPPKVTSPNTGRTPLPSNRAAPVSPPKSSRHLPSSPISPQSPPEPQYQLVALTYTGGWYRLSLPQSSEPNERAGTPEPYQGQSRNNQGRTSATITDSSSQRSVDSRTSGAKSRRRNSDAQRADSTTCQVEEFRRFGRWDGWG